MIIVGFVLFAATVVVAAALIVQNPATVTVHAFNQLWNVDMRWVVVAGLALTAIGLFALGMMRRGSARHLRLRGERRALMAENKRLVKRTAATAPAGAGRDTTPQTVPAAKPGEPVSAAPSSDRPGFLERLVPTRHRRVAG